MTLLLEDHMPMWSKRIRNLRIKIRVPENKSHPREDSLLATKKARNLITSGPISKAKNRVSAIKIHKDLLSGENEFLRLSSPKRADTHGTVDPALNITGSTVVKESSGKLSLERQEGPKIISDILIDNYRNIKKVSLAELGPEGPGAGGSARSFGYFRCGGWVDGSSPLGAFGCS
ncbi:uncharacterized protein LOC112589067 isoform X2 [Harpegnathos saltator]|uniref:uncharacterized protein LOC105190413 isoform X2 n=1 Tax=Harpegnathos saltator TaxID=610380 RepID=UPI000590438E|nr:uncharacterized protein LOC105190413 isoform X2 [Harpegnathos saltator]XP_025156723.1 uncharacterized protein LOC112589067 isoform X2 [Harpegnathos saltator]